MSTEKIEPSVIGKTIKTVHVEQDREGSHLMMTFTDGSEAGFTFDYPQQHLMFDAQYFPTDEADGEPLTIRKKTMKG